MPEINREHLESNRKSLTGALGGVSNARTILRLAEQQPVFRTRMLSGERFEGIRQMVEKERAERMGRRVMINSAQVLKRLAVTGSRSALTNRPLPRTSEAARLLQMARRRPEERRLLGWFGEARRNRRI